MEPGELFDKDKLVFTRDDYTCLKCGSQETYEELWVMYHNDRAFSGCTTCAKASMEDIFGDEEPDENELEESVRVLTEVLRKLLEAANTR